jgi:hypothetical protein
VLLPEELNLLEQRTDPIRGLGWTIILDRETSDAQTQRIIDAWKVVAAIGRADDAHLGAFPSCAEVEARLPHWLNEQVFAEHNFSFRNWCNDLEDREWIWWCGARTSNGTFRIDLQAFAMPISDWTLWAVTQIVGATVLYRDLYIRSER